MEHRYNLYRQGSSGWNSTRNEEFQEDDVWGVLGENKYTNYGFGNSNDFSSSNPPRGLTTAAKMIPRSHSNGHHEPVTQIHQQSAPVNIPDWSKIYGKKLSSKTSNNSLWLDHDDNDDDDYGCQEVRRESWESDDDEDDGDCNMIPPHEWIAKKLARTQISSFSVCEGAGRTLKGRDLKRVRNTILSKTGFLE